MNNFPVVIDGKEHWISRSVAVNGFIFTLIDEKLHVLAGKRGIGAPDEVGKWNVPSGYLDYNETLKEGCSREIAEETNLYVSPMLLHFDSIDDEPVGRQNINVRYWAFHKIFEGHTIYAKGHEDNEVEDVKWIPVSEIDFYDWAFGHKYWIAEIAYKYLDQYLPDDEVAVIQRFFLS